MGRTVIADRYELDDLPIGRGGMGEVWGGYDQRLDRRVAVKFIRFPDGRPDRELVRRFVRESRITARLEHPGVPIVYDAGTTEGEDLYLVMQLISGVAVADLVAEQQLSIGWAAAIAAQACAVLSIAHVRSLVHRDLKPTNLMLCAEGTVKVLDFGLAAAVEPTDMSRITRTGETLGTPSYMAPEQALSGVTSPQSDLYSLGCVLHEMLTGQPPFTGATPLAVMQQHMDQYPQPPRSLRAETPAGLSNLVLDLLAKKAEDRPQSATDIYQRLLAFATGLDTLPAAFAASAEPDAMRMYATVVGRVGVAAEASPTLSGEDGAFETGERASAVAGGEAAAGEGYPQGSPVPPTGPQASRSDLARARKQAGDLTRDARFSQAAEMLSGVVEHASADLGARDTDVLSVRLELADVLFLGGDYRSAAPAFQRLAADFARRDGPDSELVLHCRLQEARCHASAGETGVALRQLRSLLADERRVLGDDDERTLDLRRQIGLLLIGAGETARAREVLSELLSDLLRLSGPEHSSVRSVRELLANLEHSNVR